MTSAINRYYDPTTDEFLSIDPDVATTDQPYVFTNDDPLNAEDPLGLQGSAGVEAETKYREQVADKCDGHPERSGCRGLDINWNAVIETATIIAGSACALATVGVCGALNFAVLGTSLEVSGGALLVGLGTGAAGKTAEYALSSGKHSLSGYLISASSGALTDAAVFGVPEEAIFGGYSGAAHAEELNWLQALRRLPGYISRGFK